MNHTTTSLSQFDTPRGERELVCVGKGFMLRCVGHWFSTHLNDDDGHLEVWFRCRTSIPFFLYICLLIRRQPCALRRLKWIDQWNGLPNNTQRCGLTIAMMNGLLLIDVGRWCDFPLFATKWEVFCFAFVYANFVVQIYVERSINGY